MMGPSKRIAQRSSKNKDRDRDNISSVKNLEIIDLTSSKEDKNKKRPCRTRPQNGIVAEDRSRTRTTTENNSNRNDGSKKDSCLQSDNTKNDVKNARSKSSRVPSSSIEFDMKPFEETKLDLDSNSNHDEDLMDSQFISQDNLLLDSSQDGDQCEVRWDYTSPETMKQLKKMRGKYSAQDVKRIIANFPDMPIKPIPPTVHQFRYTAARRHDVFPEKNKIQKAKQRAPKKMYQRDERQRVAVDDMILLLQQHQQKQKKTETTSRPFEVSLEQNEATVEKADTVALGLGDNSSEDDLFQDDNSFLIEATQNLEKLFPMITKEPHNKQSENSHSSEESSEVLNIDSCDIFSSFLPSSSSVHSLCSKSVIPSSLGKNLFASPEKPLQSKSSSYKTVSHSATGSNNCSDVDSHINKPTLNVSLKTRKPNGQVHNQQNACQLSSNVSNGFDSTQRTKFRRHQTLQEKQPLSKQTAKVSSSLNSPFRKCLSFDDAINSNRKTNNSNGKAVTVNKQNNFQNISFDSSLTDELLLQATEVFDSICDRTIGNPNNACNGSNSLLKSDQQHLTVSKSGCSNNTSEPHLGLSITNTILSPVRPLKQESSVKRLQQSQVSSSPMQSFFKKTFAVEGQQAVKHKSPTGPHSTSTPVKVPKTIVGKGDEMCHDKPQIKTDSDKTGEFFMDDDSFMNDEAMFESQILPILELVETQVTGKECKTLKNPLKFSPDEIEKKRLAALQKLHKNDVPLPLNNMQRATSPDIIEQSQIPSSPRKCSQEEIKRKKQAAQRKLLARTNSTGSIPISSVSTTCSVDSHNRNDKAVVNEVKCSQEAIKFKREEALKKRRVKLMQVSNRKS